MILRHRMNLIVIVFFATISFGLSANENTKINCLSEGSDFNPTEKTMRALETTSLHYSFLDESGRVRVNLGGSYYEKNPFTLKDSISMAIIISSDETGLFAVHEQFGSPFGFNCDPSYCDPKNSSTEYKFPWVKGKAIRINLNNSISIAFGAWELHMSPLYFSKVPTYFSVGEGNVIGWIGLGTGSKARKNFQSKNPIFSIVYDLHSRSGNLIFGFNATLADTSKPVMTVTATPNWEMQLASVSVGDKSIFLVNSSQPLKIIFDLRDEEAFLPEEMVYNIINELSYYTTRCSEINCIPETREGLPPIIFTLTDNTQFSLSPEVYVQRYSDDNGQTVYFTMNMRYQSKVKFTENTIFFGRFITSHFYTVFQQIDETNTISFYELAPKLIIEQEPSTPPPMQPNRPDQQGSETTNYLQSPFDLKYILTGICATIMILLICVRISRGKKSRAENNSNGNRKINMELSQSDSDEIPLTI